LEAKLSEFSGVQESIGKWSSLLETRLTI